MGLSAFNLQVGYRNAQARLLIRFVHFAKCSPRQALGALGSDADKDFADNAKADGAEQKIKQIGLTKKLHRSTFYVTNHMAELAGGGGIDLIQILEPQPH